MAMSKKWSARMSTREKVDKEKVKPKLPEGKKKLIKAGTTEVPPIVKDVKEKALGQLQVADEHRGTGANEKIDNVDLPDLDLSGLYLETKRLLNQMVASVPIEKIEAVNAFRKDICETMVSIGFELHNLKTLKVKLKPAICDIIAGALPGIPELVLIKARKAWNEHLFYLNKLAWKLEKEGVAGVAFIDEKTGRYRVNQEYVETLFALLNAMVENSQKFNRLLVVLCLPPVQDKDLFDRNPTSLEKESGLLKDSKVLSDDPATLEINAFIRVVVLANLKVIPENTSLLDDPEVYEKFKAASAINAKIEVLAQRKLKEILVGGTSLSQEQTLAKLKLEIRKLLRADIDDAAQLIANNLLGNDVITKLKDEVREMKVDLLKSPAEPDKRFSGAGVNGEDLLDAKLVLIFMKRLFASIHKGDSVETLDDELLHLMYMNFQHLRESLAAQKKGLLERYMEDVAGGKEQEPGYYQKGVGIFSSEAKSLLVLLALLERAVHGIRESQIIAQVIGQVNK